MSQPNLRPVMLSKTVAEPDPNRPPGYATYVQRDQGPATFHCFGYELDNDTLQPYSVAIVELPDGKVMAVLPHLIRFLDKEASHG